jgi:hypothetical protein
LERHDASTTVTVGNSTPVIGGARPRRSHQHLIKISGAPGQKRVTFSLNDIRVETDPVKRWGMRR